MEHGLEVMGIAAIYPQKATSQPGLGQEV